MPVDLSIKNVPDELAALLRERAKWNHRSLQGELMALLQETLATPERRPLSVQEAIARIKTLGFQTPGDSTRLIRKERDAR